MSRVLLINDEPDLIEMCEIVLEANGHSTRHTIAPHRVRELRTLASWEPDVIVLDLVMPTTTGEQVMRRLRRFSQTAEVPVVVMSAMEDGAERAAAMGASGFLEKPFDPDTLTLAVNRALQQRAPGSLRQDSSSGTQRHQPQR